MHGIPQAPGGAASHRRGGAPKKRGGAPKKRVNGSQRRHEDVAAAVLAEDDNAEDQTGTQPPYMQMQPLAPAPSFPSYAANAAPPYASLAAPATNSASAAGWQTLQDPSSGAFYYYNAAALQSSWSWPPESASAPPAQPPAQTWVVAPRHGNDESHHPSQLPSLQMQPPSSLQRPSPMQLEPPSVQLAPAPSLQPYGPPSFGHGFGQGGGLSSGHGGGPAFAQGFGGGLGSSPSGGPQPDAEGLTPAFAQRFSSLHAELANTILSELTSNPDLPRETHQALVAQLQTSLGHTKQPTANAWRTVGVRPLLALQQDSAVGDPPTAGPPP